MAASPFVAPVFISALLMKQADYQEEDIIGGTRDFQAAFPNINVNLTFVPYEQLGEKVITSAQAGILELCAAR